MNVLLYGHDPSPGFVAAHALSDGQIRIYTRQNGKTSHHDAEFFPFLFLSDPTLLEGFDRKHWLKELDGSNFFRFLAVFTRWTDMWQGVRQAIEQHRKKTKEEIDGYTNAHFLHVRPDPLSQYFMQSGTTLFKGMVFEDLRRMQISLFTHASGPVSDPRKTEDRILAAALSDTTGWKEVVDGRKLDEPTLLRRILSAVAENDPDVLEGHNLIGHDLPFLKQRYALNEIECGLGRDGAELRRLPPQRWSGFDADPEGGGFELPGRHLIDVLDLAETYDFSKRSLESVDLSSLAAHFSGDPGRKQSERIPLQKLWEEKPKSVLALLEQNISDIRLIGDHLLPSSFYMAQMVPMSLGVIAHGGSASKIESLMVREYLRRKHSLPRPEQGTQTTGGYADILFTGIFERVLHADVESL
ncbi:MAG TPA: 3'-5' exonuclease, partial [Bacteroidota bacterium]